MRTCLFILAWCLCRVVQAEQAPLIASVGPAHSDENSWFQLPHKIERVAVIGAGPSGLQSAAALLADGFQVRLFERAPNPGGAWFYTDKTPIAATFPNRPVKIAGYVPDIPNVLPLTREYSNGDEGLSNDWRLREHWSPSPVWAGMTSTVPSFSMKLLNVEYAPDTRWKVSQRTVQRHVRQYASSVGLNSNDDEFANVTSYSTRVERVQKLSGTNRWTLTLRKMRSLPNGRLRVEWWTEEFDAVIVGMNTDYDAASVPSIPGLKEWAEAYPAQIQHSRGYRTSEAFKDKNVLILGGSFSGLGIAKDLAPFAASITTSIRRSNVTQKKDVLLSKFPKNTTFISEISAFPSISSISGGLSKAALTLKNGSTISGFDHVFLATGFLQSYPFLCDYHNGTIVGIDEPETDIAPIITDGTHLRSLYWTGHYINDPTLAFSNVDPWDLGEYQSLGFSRFLQGKARLPSIPKMWKMYPGPKKRLTNGLGLNSYNERSFVTWLNNESLEFGGRLISPLPTKYREPFSYLLSMSTIMTFNYPEWGNELDNRPRSEWPIYNGKDEFVGASRSSREDSAPHWAELTTNW